MDHYRTLGVRSDATKEEIKEAFRRSALEFHPDRHSRSSPEVREAASRRFQKASEAYDVLVDDLRRADYDFLRRSSGRWQARGYERAAPRYGYGGGGGGSGGYRRPPTASGGGGFDASFIFRHLMRRGMLVNLTFAGALLVGAVIIERSIEAIWKANNSGKSFEAAMESIEKNKVEKDSS